MSGQGKEIKSIDIEELKERGFGRPVREPEKIIVILDDLIADASPEAREAAWEWFARSREGTLGGAQGARTGGSSGGDDAGAAKVQSDEADGGGRRDAGGSGDHARSGEASASFATGRIVWMKYLNWRGEMRWRRVLPHAWRVGETKWHSGRQWLFSATDLEDGQIKEFAMGGVFGWEVAADQSLPWRS